MRNLRVLGFGSSAPIAGLVLLLAALALASGAAANEVVQWNETTMKAIGANGPVLVRIKNFFFGVGTAKNK